jgi:adenylate cyclase
LHKEGGVLGNRITAQLIEAMSGTHLWVERYDRLLDTPSPRDELTNSVVGAIELSLTRRDRAGQAHRQPRCL